MHCLDFERLWNERLDARDHASSDLQQALEAHAVVCPACRKIASRYQTLLQVLRSAACPPAPPADFPLRFLQACDLDRSPVRRPVRIRMMMGPLALAASLLLVAFLGWRSLPEGPGPKPSGKTEAPRVAADDPPLLIDALVTASSATWDLALETSAPAARIGREFLDAATFREPSPAPGPAPVTELALTLPISQTEVLQSVGEGVNARVLPLSGTAQHAFGFLLGRPADNVIPAANPTSGG
jgi:hypothetical protein